jgi:DNA primase
VARIDPESIDQVRRAADLVELVRGQVALVRRGGRWWGRCPFHDEKTPSFCLIPPENARYYCYGCGATGDAFTWMQEREGAGGFGEAVEALADRFGVPLRVVEASPQEQARRAAEERRLQLLERAAGFYSAYLWAAEEAEPARGYLLGRGFDEALLRAFRIGYAPGGGQVLAGRAIREGFSREQLADAGLARLRGGAAHDFFVSRITFPIADSRGRVRGFGARTMNPADSAKYVNSPESEHFRKRNLLFGAHQARQAAARAGWTLVVEGYTDVLALHAAGIPNAVACMGTALTRPQLQELRRLGNEVRLSFDADRAGERAAARTLEAAHGMEGLELTAIRLPAGRDPGDLGGDEAGRRELAACAAAPEPLLEWVVWSCANRSERSAAGRRRALADIEGYLALVPPDQAIERDEAVRRAVGLLELPPELERRLRATPYRPPQGDAPPRPVLRELTAVERRERRLLALAMALPGPGARELAGVPEEVLEAPEHRRAMALILSGADPWPADLADLEGALRADAAAGGSEEELREAAFRVQEHALERRAAALRSRGDERELLHVLELLRRLRAAARGG